MPRRPNILLILGDQHRHDCLGIAGNRDVRTPHLDSVARDGVHYQNTFCPYPVCTPSRYSIFTGLYVHEHRGWSNHCTPAPGTAAFPAMLRDAGYRTRAVGKMHFTPTYLDIGFSDMELAEQDGEGRWDDDYHRYLMERGLVDQLDLEDQRREYRQNAPEEYWEHFGALRSDLPEEHHSTTWIGDRAVEAVEGWTGDANFLTVSFIKPHHPFDPPAPWDGLYAPDDMRVLPGWTDEPLPRDLAFHGGYFPHGKLTRKAIQRCAAYYYATITQMDHHIGRLLDALKAQGMYDDTLILYTTDHGEYLGYHHLLLKGNYMYDPLMRVPLIVKYPGAAQSKGLSGALVNLVDIAPTVLGQTEVAPADAMKGIDLATAAAGRDCIFAECSRGNMRMACTATHKLIAADTDAAPLLFDLQADPFEIENRAEDSALKPVLDDLSQRLDAWRPREVDMKAYLDEDAPIISAPNAVPHDDGHREKIIAYYDEKMKERQGK